MKLPLRGLIASLRGIPARGVISVVCGFLLMISLGGLFTFGNLTTYITSYLHVKLGEDVGYGQTVWVGASLAFTEGFTLLPGSEAYRLFGPKAALISGCLLSTISIAFTYLTVKTSLPWVALTYGALNGFGIGFVYSAPLLVGYRWFPHNQGLVSGVVVGGYGLGGIVFTTMQTGFINPENVSPSDDGLFHDAELLERVPKLFLLMAGVCASAQFIGILGIQNPPERSKSVLNEDMHHGDQVRENETRDASRMERLDDGSHVDDLRASKVGNEFGRKDEHLETLDSGDENYERNENSPEGSTCYTTKQAMLTLQMYQLIIGFMGNSFAVAVITSLWKSFGQTFIRDDRYMEVIGSGCAIFNMLGRLLWGASCDKLTYKPTMVLLSGLFSVLMLILPSAAFYESRVMFTVWMWGIFFSFSGIYTIVITGVVNTYGLDHAGSIYGVIFFAGAVMNPVATLLTELLLDSHGYSLMFLIGGIFAVLGLFATLTLQPIQSQESPTPS